MHLMCFVMVSHNHVSTNKDNEVQIYKLFTLYLKSVDSSTQRPRAKCKTRAALEICFVCSSAASEACKVNSPWYNVLFVRTLFCHLGE